MAKLTDAAIVYFYRHVLIPWEKKFKDDDSSLPTAKEISWPANVKIRQIDGKEFRKTLSELKRQRAANYLVFARGNGKKSRTLYYRLRCAFARATITTSGQKLMIQGKKNGKLNISGQVSFDTMKLVLEAISPL